MQTSCIMTSQYPKKFFMKTRSLFQSPSTPEYSSLESLIERESLFDLMIEKGGSYG